MILKIQNLGPIKQMEIDFSKDFFIFCGANNTGKTYATYILFSFLNQHSLSDYLYTSLNCFDLIEKSIFENGGFKIKKEYLNEWLARTCESVIAQFGGIFGISNQTKGSFFPDFKLSALFSEEDYEKTLHYSTEYIRKVNSLSIKIFKKEDDDFIYLTINGIDTPYSTHSGIIKTFLNELFKELIFRNNGNARILTVERNSIYTSMLLNKEIGVFNLC